jgi:hypothetical protein
MGKFWQKNNTSVILVLLLVIFIAYSVFLAINLESGYIPDEGYRYNVSTYFATTWGIPDELPLTQTTGEEQHRNPFMGYWLFGRALNVFSLINPDASARQGLVALRILNSLFALGVAWFTYLISKELIKNKWLQLLPVFMLTNTLMFVFLSGGVSYDNPANFFCTLGIYFFIRVLKDKQFLTNSLAWMVCIAFGALIKHTVLPLAAGTFVSWLIYIIKRRGKLSLKELGKKPLNYVLALALLIVVGLNVYLYGVNLVKYQSLKPSCYDTFSREVCDESVFIVRLRELGLPEKLTLVEAFKQGFPDPIRFTFDIWIREMLKRIFGIMGGAGDYFPINVAYFHIALYWIILLGFRYLRKIPVIVRDLLLIFAFYCVVLIYTNYNSELAYGFYKYVALQGRYLFPVISICFVLATYVIEQVKNKFIQLSTVVALAVLFLYGGPIRFIWYHDSVFANWFI